MSSRASVSPRTVPMTPDRSIRWPVYDIESLESRLYVSPEYDTGPASMAVKTIVNMAQHGAEREPKAEELASGGWSTAYKVGGFVAKQLHADRTPDDGVFGLGATQALLTLDEGLKRVEQPFKNVHFEAVTPYACLVAGDSEQARTTMAMSYAEGGRPPWAEEGLPDRTEREKFYDTAIGLCGAEAADIGYDDQPDNMTYQIDDAGMIRITKFDVYGTQSFADRMRRPLVLQRVERLKSALQRMW